MDPKLEKELKEFQRRKGKAQEKGDLIEEAKLCNACGELLSQYGFFAKAIKEHKQELQLSEAVHDTIGCAIAHRKVGEALCALGKHKEALFHQSLHLELAKSGHNLVEQQRAWATIGRTWFVYSDNVTDQSEVEESLVEAQKAYLESLSVCDELQGEVQEKELLEMRSRLYLNLGLVYEARDDISNARKFMDKALVISRDQNLADTEYRCLYSIGGQLLKIGQDQEGLNYIDKAVKVAQTNNNKFDEADALMSLGQAHLKVGDFVAARRILKKALKLSKTRLTGDTEILKTNLVSAIRGLQLVHKLEKQSSLDQKDHLDLLDRLGDVYSNVRSFEKALRCYSEELTVAKSLGLPSTKLSPIYVSLAMTYTDLKQPSKALECYREELESIAGNYKGMCDTWCNVAQVHEQSGHDFEEIEHAYRKALENAEKADRPHAKIRVLQCLADTQKKYGKDVLHAETRERIEKLEVRYGIESDSEDDSDRPAAAGGDEEEGDEDDIIKREMLIPDSESDNDDEEHDRTRSRRQARTTRQKVNRLNERGETPLHVAAIAGDATKVRTLIERGADINSRDYCGWQPLHEACNHGNIDVVKVLVQLGADVNDPGGPHCNGITPLHDSAQNGHLEVVQLLITNGASTNIKNKSGQTALAAVVAMRKAEDDADGADTEESTGRREVERYLRQIARGGPIGGPTPRVAAGPSPAASQHRDKQPEMKRRNRLTLPSDSDEEEEEVVVPSMKSFTDRLKQRDAARARPPARTPSTDSEDSDTEELIARGLNPPPIESSSTADHPKEPVTAAPFIDTLEDIGSSSEDELRFEGFDDEALGLDSLNDEQNNNQNKRRRSLEALRTHGASTVYVDVFSGRGGGDKNVPALIPEGEISAHSKRTSLSEWLEDDMPQTRPLKRRKTSKQTTLSAAARNPPSSNRTTPSTSAPRSRTSGVNLSRRATQPKQTRLEVNRGPSPTIPHGTQSSRDIIQVSNNVPTRSGPNVGGSISRPHSAPPDPVPSRGPPPMRLRVQVQGKTFLIPCPQNGGDAPKTVAWLSEQASLRYFSSYGLRPVLALQTNEGAFLSPDDNITDVLSNNEQVMASLESWDLPPLADRYKTACLSANTDARTDVLAMLQADPQLSAVVSRNLSLTAGHMLPLMRALQCHDKLVKLVLPGNRLGDNGVEHIVASLATLPNLAVISMRSNGISHTGLNLLASALTRATAEQQEARGILLKLEELDMAFNPLGDPASSSLAVIVQSCAQMSTLDLTSCALSGKPFQAGTLLADALRGSKQLRHLSLAHNSFGPHGIRDSLAALPSHASRLNLSCVTADAPELNWTENSLLCKDLRELILRDCCLDTGAVEVLVSRRNVTQGLRILDLSCNAIGDDVAESLAKLFEVLEELNLSGNSRIGHTTLLTLISAMTKATSSLRTLSLSACGVFSPLPPELPSDLERLRQGGGTRCRLSQLDLSYNPLSMADRRLLDEAWGVQEDSVSVITGPMCLLCIKNK